MAFSSVMFTAPSLYYNSAGHATTANFIRVLETVSIKPLQNWQHVQTPNVG